MTGREPNGEPEVDDWFAEPERTMRLRRRESERAPDAEDWTDDDNDREIGIGVRALRPEAKLGLAVAALAVILLIGLAAAGVFSSGTKKARPPVTTPPTTTAQTATTPQTPAVVVPATPLKPGDTGAKVKELQQALAKLAYLSGTADGKYGPATTAAVKSFQQVAGLTTDGVAGPKTLAALRSAANSTSTGPATFDAPTNTLAPGDTGSQVLILQRELTGLGYSTDTLDGTYGSKTVAAVKAFQQAAGLTPDGIVGTKTLQALKSRSTSG
ncbi:MAG TPA: peptidoglycan-binding protein [Gaiellaceae bacterium]|nr:peptidoglycan-binding protein [Gaiellaceae bacterium]